MTKKRLTISLVSIILLIVFVIGSIFTYIEFFPKKEKPRDLVYRNKSIDIVVSHLVRMEKPDAKSVYLADEEAEAYRKYFENAGLFCASKGDEGAYKLVFLAGKEPKSWAPITSKVAKGGAIAWALDVRHLTAHPFKRMLTSFPCAFTRIWMPGEFDWLLTGHLESCALKLDVLLDSFSPDGAINDLTSAECDSLPELYANYVGVREEILPALDDAKDLPLRPECFIPTTIPSFDWLLNDGVEKDIYEPVRHELRSFQVVRRLVVEGNMLSLQKDGIDAAIDKWSSAITRNPHDTMLLDRIYRLAVNAKAFEQIGNLRGAAKCYETMVSIRPKDIAALRCYAESMKRLGQKEIADAALKRIAELTK